MKNAMISSLCSVKAVSLMIIPIIVKKIIKSEEE